MRVVIGMIVVVMMIVAGGRQGDAQESVDLTSQWIAAPSAMGEVQQARFFQLTRMIRIDFKGDSAVLWLSSKLRSTVSGTVKEAIEKIVKESEQWIPSLSLPGRYINLERVGWIQASESQEIRQCKPERCLIHLVYDEGTLEKILLDLTKLRGLEP